MLAVKMPLLDIVRDKQIKVVLEVAERELNLITHVKEMADRRLCVRPVLVGEMLFWMKEEIRLESEYLINTIDHELAYYVECVQVIVTELENLGVSEIAPVPYN